MMHDLIVATVELSYRADAYRESAQRFLDLGQSGVLSPAEARRLAQEQTEAAQMVDDIRSRFSAIIGTDITDIK